MKKILLVLLVSLFTMPSLAQQNVQQNNLLEDGRLWATCVFELFDIEDETYLKYLELQLAEEGYGYFCYLKINGDTLIEGNVYKKIYNLYHHLYENSIDEKLEAFIRCKNGKYLYRFLSEKNIDEYKEKYPDSFDGDDFILFNENWVAGDTTDKKEIITEVADTLYNTYSDKVLKYWKIKPLHGNSSRNYFSYFNDIKWVSGVGFPTTLRIHHEYEVDCLCEDVLLYCVAANGDTLYRNNYYWYPHLTSIPTIPKFEISTKVLNGGLVVYIDAATDWSATLYNSNGVTVAQQQGSGSEIFLPTDSKGTHILVVKAGGKVVKKKVLLR